jgi:hypothetical protein
MSNGGHPNGATTPLEGIENYSDMPSYTINSISSIELMG